eukprot:4539747-Pyramimonas_sp.AAC.1
MVWSTKEVAYRLRLSVLLGVQNVGLQNFEAFLIAEGQSRVLQRWRLTPASLELRVRRSNWPAQIARFPVRHAHVFTALFAELPIDGWPQCDYMGRLTVYANPWARLFFADLESLAALEEGEELLARLQGYLWALRWDEEVGKCFCKIDCALLRRRQHIVAIPLPGYVCRPNVATSL